jgi:hypothetical protein
MGACEFCLDWGAVLASVGVRLEPPAPYRGLIHGLGCPHKKVGRLV